MTGDRPPDKGVAPSLLPPGCTAALLALVGCILLLPGLCFVPVAVSMGTSGLLPFNAVLMGVRLIRQAFRRRPD